MKSSGASLCLLAFLTALPLAAQETAHEFPQTLGAQLPPPGRLPGWPFAAIGQWKVDTDADFPRWLADLKTWRAEHLKRMGYDDAQYRRPELKWSQRDFIQTQMMIEERYFYDPVAGRYTVDRYLDDLEQRFGGIDSVLLWYVYTNAGIDNRNHWDLARDLPGGVAGLRQVVKDFHRRGVRVFIPTMAWDNGTRDPGMPHWQAVAELAAEIGADGVNADTYKGVPRAFRTASDATGHPVIFEAENPPWADEGIMWNNQSWGYWDYGFFPTPSKVKWLEPRHMINLEDRWARDKTDDLQHAFFNGIGYLAWENVWGVWNQITPRDAAALRRVAAIERECADLLVSLDWEPYTPTVQRGVYASKFPGKGATLWTLVNRNEYAIDDDQLSVPYAAGRRYYDLWNGVELSPRIVDGRVNLSSAVENHGFAAFLAVDRGTEMPGLVFFLEKMHRLAAVPLTSLSHEWHSLPHQMVAVAATKPAVRAPAGMVTVPAAEFNFRVTGIEIEGFTWEGLDFQYPWENSARREHRHTMRVPTFHMDRYPVTNRDYKKFIDATHYRPADDHNFLKDWRNGAPQAGWENKPVTWVSIEDARAYAAWAGKRLPHEWEWQYAAQGRDGRLYPWGNEWNAAAVPVPNKGRELLPPDDVDAHPAGASVFGVMDLVGNVWQWTDEFADEHTRAAALRGGSSYQPQTSYWYFPQAYRLDQHGKYLLMAPAKDRSGMLGFRCVVDAGK